MSNFDRLVKQYNDIKYRIRRLVLKQQELRELGGLPRTGENEGMPKTPGYNGSPIEKFVSRLCELEEEQMLYERKLEDLRADITIIIDKIPNTTIREVLEYKVFMSKGWRYISRCISYSVSRVRQFYDEGIAIIRQVEGGGYEVGQL